MTAAYPVVPDGFGWKDSRLRQVFTHQQIVLNGGNWNDKADAILF